MSDQHADGTEHPYDAAIVGDCAGCGGQMIETFAVEEDNERTLRCQDCDAEAELRHDFDDGLGGASWSGVGDPELKTVSWIDCPRCHGHGEIEDPICDLRRAMNGREHPCPNCDASGSVPRIVETDGGNIDPEPSSVAFDRWLGKADENIEEWGLQDERTLLLAIQEELGELTQAVLEASAEDGDPDRIDEELDDLGALLLQFHEARNQRYVGTGTEQSEGRQ